MKLRLTIFLFGILCFQFGLKAQVWYPQGVYTQGTPSLITVDNQVIAITKVSSDINNSYWQVSIEEGPTWRKLPLLMLNKAAEILDIKKYAGMVHICGNFTFDNGNHNALLRFNGNNWQGFGYFKKQGGLPASILTMDVQKANLIIGGSFFTINSDTLPFIARHNGFKFSEYFDQCKDCGPDNIVIDIASNDTITAISGQFTTINHQKSKYLYRFSNPAVGDTFLFTPKLIEKIALDGSVIYGLGGSFGDKRMFKVTDVFTEINKNIDSAISISEILIWDGKPVVCGVFNMLSNIHKPSVLTFENNAWKDISNNFKNPIHIATGRSILLASGNPVSQISIWNPNKFIVRFYPNLSLVKASVFLDSNNNCIREKNEKALSKQYIKLPFINKGVFTNEHGLTEFLVPNNIQNTLRFVVKPFRNFVRSNCADTVVNRTFYPGVYMDSIQFPLNRIPDINDIRVTLSSPRGKQVLKNTKVVYYINYENVGSKAISGNIRLRKSPLFTKELTLPLYKTKVNDSLLEWQYTNLQPGEKKLIVYSGYPESAEFDQQFQFDAQVSSSIAGGSSSYSEDDSDSIPQEVTQSSDAFKKFVYPTPQLGDSITYLHSEDRDLRYTIVFNNFSTDTVFYAVVIDTLDLNLDMSYIEETGSNKAYYTEVQTDPNNQYKGILIWHFPNIRLVPNPGMNYEIMESGSYIGFKVVTKPLSQGYYLKNTASVFYDNTFAGNTNAVYCTLALTDIDELQSGSDKIKIFPNPFAESFELKATMFEGDLIRIMDASGKEIFQTNVLKDCDSIDVTTLDLNSGIYIVQLISNGQIYNKKIIKS